MQVKVIHWTDTKRDTDKKEDRQKIATDRQKRSAEERSDANLENLADSFSFS